MEQQQQGSSTPTGVAATDPMQMNGKKHEDERAEAFDIGLGIEANIPGGRLAQRGMRKYPPQQE